MLTPATMTETEQGTKATSRSITLGKVNLLLAILSLLFLTGAYWINFLPEAFALIVLANISLGVFNLVPIPPLDGSKVLFALLPASRSAYNFMAFLERYGLILIFAFIFGSFRCR